MQRSCRRSPASLHPCITPQSHIHVKTHLTHLLFSKYYKNMTWSYCTIVKKIFHIVIDTCGIPCQPVMYGPPLPSPSTSPRLASFLFPLPSPLSPLSSLLSPLSFPHFLSKTMEPCSASNWSGTACLCMASCNRNGLFWSDSDAVHNSLCWLCILVGWTCENCQSAVGAVSYLCCGLKMSMITSLAWIPRGAPRSRPIRFELSAEEYDRVRDLAAKEQHALARDIGEDLEDLRSPLEGMKPLREIAPFPRVP